MNKLMHFMAASSLFIFCFLTSLQTPAQQSLTPFQLNTLESARQYRQHAIDVFIGADINQIATLMHPDIYVVLSGVQPIVGKEAAVGFYNQLFTAYTVLEDKIIGGDGVWYISKDGQTAITTFSQFISLQTITTPPAIPRKIDFEIDTTQTFVKYQGRWIIASEHSATRTPLPL